MAARLMITGYGGFVAGSVVWHAIGNRDSSIHALAREPVPTHDDRVDCTVFDLRDHARLEAAFAAARPDAVVHTAALADIDYCQRNPLEADEINVGVTRHLARLCAAHHSKLVFCSTDTVFDGARGNYIEEDPPVAVNVYAETKIAAEHIVRETVAHHVVARLSLVVGLPIHGAGNSFLAKMLKSLDAGEHLAFPRNEIRTPIDVITLGRALLELAGNDFSGTIHLAGSTRLDRYDMACRIAQRFGYDAASIDATDSNAITGRAPRPNDASLNNAKARKMLATPMLAFDEGLERIARMKEEPPIES